jgi:uncharacterized ion transporter superfamily protein YfcC
LSKAQLAAQVLEEQAEKERLESSRNKIMFGSILSIVLLISAILLYAFYQKRKANLVLENKNREILRQQDEIIRQRDELDESNKELDKKITRSWKVLIMQN